MLFQVLSVLKNSIELSGIQMLARWLASLPVVTNSRSGIQGADKAAIIGLEFAIQVVNRLNTNLS